MILAQTAVCHPFRFRSQTVPSSLPLQLCLVAPVLPCPSCPDEWHHPEVLHRGQLGMGQAALETAHDLGMGLLAAVVMRHDQRPSQPAKHHFQKHPQNRGARARSERAWHQQIGEDQAAKHCYWAERHAETGLWPVTYSGLHLSGTTQPARELQAERPWVAAMHQQPELLWPEERPAEWLAVLPVLLQACGSESPNSNQASRQAVAAVSAQVLAQALSLALTRTLPRISCQILWKIWSQTLIVLKAMACHPFETTPSKVHKTRSGLAEPYVLVA